MTQHHGGAALGYGQFVYFGIVKPAAVAVCIDHRSDNIDVFRNAAFLGVNVLAADQSDLSKGLRRNRPVNGISW